MIQVINSKNTGSSKKQLIIEYPFLVPGILYD